MILQNQCNEVVYLPQENQTHKAQSQQETPREQLKVGSETYESTEHKMLTRSSFHSIYMKPLPWTCKTRIIFWSFSWYTSIEENYAKCRKLYHFTKMMDEGEGTTWELWTGCAYRSTTWSMNYAIGNEQFTASISIVTLTNLTTLRQRPLKPRTIWSVEATISAPWVALIIFLNLWWS